MKSSVLLLGVSALFVSESYAQKNAPDALNYEFPEKKLGKFQLADSTVKHWSDGIDLDSLMRSLPLNQGNIKDLKGSAKVMPPAILLDQEGISEADGYITGGQKYYIRNLKPLIEPKEVSPGIYICK